MSETLPRVMLVTDRRRVQRGTLADAIVAASHGGLRLVQLRDTDLDRDARARLLDDVRERAMPGTKLLVNGDTGLAASAGCGLHLPEAGALPAGAPRPLGRSVHSLRALAAALDEGVDYAIWGTVYPTASKPGVEPCGPGVLEGACRLAGETPLFAIGGVDATRVPALLKAGVWGVAVCGAILDTPDPVRAARRLCEAVALGSGETVG